MHPLYVEDAFSIALHPEYLVKSGSLIIVVVCVKRVSYYIVCAYEKYRLFTSDASTLMSSSPVHVSAVTLDDPEAWVIVGKDLRSSQEVSLVDGDMTVVWPHHENSEVWRPFYCSNFHSACREAADIRQKIDDQLSIALRCVEIDDFPCIKSLFQRPLCDAKQRARTPICLMVVGSDDSLVKRDLLGALLGVRLQASLGEHVLVRYVFVTDSCSPCQGDYNSIKSILVHFRRDALGTGVSLASLPQAISFHLKRNGAGAPLSIKSYGDLVQLLSRDLSASASELDSGWEPVSNSFASLLQEVVIEVAFGEQFPFQCSFGLEILDGPSVQELIDSPTSRHNNANILVCALPSPSSLTRSQMIRLMSFGIASRIAPSSSPLFLFADCRSHSDEDSCKFAVDAQSAGAPAEATHMISDTTGIFSQSSSLESERGAFYARAGVSASCPGMERFTRCLVSFSKNSQREGSLRLLQDSTCLLQEIKVKINLCHSLMSRDSAVAVQGSSLRSPELFELRREHQAAICEVQLLLCSRRDEVIRVAEQFIKECADLMPNFADEARPSIRVGVIGSLYGTSREGFAKEIEAHVRVKLEERINLWSVQTLLPLIDNSLKFLETKLGHRAQAHVLKLHDITGTVAKRGAIAFEARKAADSSNTERHLSILSSVPTVSNQLASYFDVTKSLLTIVSGHLIASSGLIVVGALCSIASVIRAWRSSGSETEQAIKQLVGSEMGKLLRLKASDIAKTISEKLLEPISDFIAHYEEAFTAEVDMLIESIEAGPLARAQGQNILEAKLQLLRNAASSLDVAADNLCRSST
jgi:hypothetical protein